MRNVLKGTEEGVKQMCKELEEMRQLEKQLETIDHKLWYYETAIEAGTEDIHKK